MKTLFLTAAFMTVALAAEAANDAEIKSCITTLKGIPQVVVGTICKDQSLRALNRITWETSFSLMDKLEPNEQQMVASAGNDWLRAHGKCGENKKCLTSSYALILSLLNDLRAYIDQKN